MPWCEECARYLAPSGMSPDGSCPSCGGVLGVQGPVSGRDLDLKKLAGDADH